MNLLILLRQEIARRLALPWRQVRARAELRADGWVVRVIVDRKTYNRYNPFETRPLDDQLYPTCPTRRAVIAAALALVRSYGPHRLHVWGMKRRRRRRAWRAPMRCHYVW